MSATPATTARHEADASDEVEVLRRTLRNGVALLFAYLLPRGFTFASVIVAARVLGAGDFGSYGTAAAFAVILSIVATLGMAPLLVREIACEPDRASALLRAAHIVKTGSNAVMLVALVLLGKVIGYDDAVARAALLLGSGYALGSYAENMSAYFQAVERMHIWTQASAIFGLVSGVSGIALILATRSLVWFCLAPSLGWAAGLVWLWARAPEPVRRGQPVRRSDVIALLRAVLPFAAAFVLLTMYYKVDVLLLARWTSPVEVGIYAAAYKFVDIFQALMIVATAAVYPGLSRAAAARVHGEAWVGGRSSELMLMGGVVVGGGLYLLGESVVLALFGDAYAASTEIVHTLAVVLPCLAITIHGGYVLAAAERMGAVAALYAGGLVLNVGLNLWLIPARAGEGAAFAMLGSELVLAVAFVLVLRQVAGAAPRVRVTGAAGAVLAVGIVLGAASGAIGSWVATLIFLAAAGLVYRFTDAFGAEDLAMLRRALRPGLAKQRSMP